MFHFIRSFTCNFKGKFYSNFRLSGVKASLLNIKINHDLWVNADCRKLYKAAAKLQKNL